MELSSDLKDYIKNHQIELENNLFDCFAVDVLVKGGAYLFEEACELCLNEFGENLNNYIRNDYVIEDDVVFSGDKKILYKYAPKKYDLKYVIPSTVETIHYEAFEDNLYIEDIEIPANVTHIGSRAFYNCKGLKQIRWSGAKTSGHEVFVGCTNLKAVHVDSIDDFENCRNLTLKGYAGSYVEKYAKENEMPFEAIELVIKGYAGGFTEKCAKENGFPFEAIEV